MKKLIVILILMALSNAQAIDWERIIDIPKTYVRDVMTTNLTELECLALNIYHEARNQPLLGQRLVAQVTYNRMIHEGFPDTICGVVREYKQFSWTHDGKVDHPTNKEAYKDAYLIAISFLVLNQHVDTPYYSLLLNYHATYVKPHWPRLQPVIRYGDHLFYVRKKDINM